MMNPVSKSLFLYPALAFSLTIILGLWLSRLGKPYQQILFNFHKLIALAAVVLVGLQFSKWIKFGEIPPLMNLLMVLIAIMTIILFASGALMSLDKLDYKLMHLLHQIASVGLVSLGIIVCLHFF